jgi:alpha-1,2-mannosyltransferase
MSSAYEPRMLASQIASTIRRARAVDPIMVFVFALLLRIGLVIGSRGGPLGIVGYDPAVYYAAADALTHGRLPYTDFVLLHPPALMLALTPFAVLGQLTTDHAGFVVANAAFAVLGAINAVLVVQIARAMGLSRRSSLLGGAFYAVWWGAISAEITARLEPLGSFAFLCGLLAMAQADTAVELRRRHWLFVSSGAAFGVAASTKIWWIVPVIVVVGWRSRIDGSQSRISGATSRRGAVAMLIGIAMAVAAVNGPFFANAPGAMWRMVITDQLGRPVMTSSRVARLAELASIHAALPKLHRSTELVLLAVLIMVLVGLGIAAWQTAQCRVVVLVAAAQLLVLMLAPTYFTYYSGFAAASISLLVAGAAHRSGGVFLARLGSWIAGGSVVAAAAATTAAFQLHMTYIVSPFPGDELAPGVTASRCVMADSPMALIELDALSRDFVNHCPNWVDVSGRTYDADAAPAGHWVRRSKNHQWQRDLRRYLFSGDAVIVIRPADGLSRATRNAIRDHPILETNDGFVVYRVRPPVGRAG